MAAKPKPKPKPKAEDPPATLPAALTAALAANSGVALRLPGPDDPGTFTYDQLATAAGEVGRGLAALGIAVGDRVAILSSTRPEWTLADVGALLAGAVVVPIYFTNSPEECEYVLAHSGTKVVLCEDADQLAKVEKVAARCPELEVKILLTGQEKGAMTLDELRAKGRAGGDPKLLDRRRAAVKPGDVATIVYTSGTTGPPKGCMLTHANILAATTMYGERLDLNSSMSIYMYLPLAHALARIAQMVALTAGGTIIFWRGDAKKIIDELAEAKPTHFPSVPRVFEKVHARIHAGVSDAPRLRRAMFNWAVAEGGRRSARDRDGKTHGPLAQRRHALADKLVLAKVRAAFGGNLVVALTGAAPIGQDILEFFDACGLLVLEGYGLTETCAASTINTRREHRFGTIGRPLPGSDVAVAEDGELRLRGPQVFAGYYREREATQATLDGAWLQTGDLGEIDGDGYVRITGRKKDLIITSSGKNISPSNIEEQLRESRFISQAVVFGDRRSYLVALLTIDPDEAAALAQRAGSDDDDLAALSEHPGVRAELQQAVDGVNARLARIEQVKRFAILDHDLSQETGELTPTLKIKRPVVAERYGTLVEELYGA
jgi:long-chain acyl-CoA synthetase